MPGGRALVPFKEHSGSCLTATTPCLFIIASSGVKRPIYHCSCTDPNVRILASDFTYAYTFLYRGFVKIRLSDQRVQAKHNTENVFAGITFNSEGVVIESDQIALIAPQLGSIIVYDSIRNTKSTKINGLNLPTSISSNGQGTGRRYAVAEVGYKQIKIYNSYWQPIHTIQHPQYMKSPFNAFMLNTDKVLVVDRSLGQVSEFTTRGQYIRAWLTQSRDRVSLPAGVSFCHPYLWIGGRYVGRQKDSVMRFRIY